MKADIKGALARPAAAPRPGPLRGLPLDCVLPPRPWVAGHHAAQEGRWGWGRGAGSSTTPKGAWASKQHTRSSSPALAMAPEVAPLPLSPRLTAPSY